MSLSKKMFGLTAIAVIGVTSACTATDTEDAKADEITIGVLADFSSTASQNGLATQNAAQLAVNEINAAGGVNGKELVVEFADDASTPSTAISATERLISKNSASAVFAQVISSSRDASLPVAEKNEIPFFYATVGEGGVCSPSLFNVGEVPSQQLAPVIADVQADTGNKKWFLLGNDYVWPRATFDSAKKYIEAAGGEVVGEEYVPLGTTDFQAVLSKIKASGADIMIPAVVGSDAIAFEKQASDANLGNDTIQRLGILYEANTRVALGESVSAGMLNTVMYDTAIETPENEAFLDAYEAEFGADAPEQTTISIGSYNAIKMWAEAANTAGNLDLESITEGISGTSFSGPAGTISFNDSRYASIPINVTAANTDGSVQVVTSYGDVAADEKCEL